MNTFTLKGTFLDTPAPDTLRVREGYLLCENGLCAGFSETAPAGVKFSTIRVKSSRRVLWTCICTRRSTAIAARRWIWSCWTGCSSTPTRGSPLRRPGLRQAGLLLFCARPEKQRHNTRLHLCDAAHRRNARLMHQLRGAGLSAFVGKLGMDRNSLTATVSRPPPRVWPRRAAGWIPATPKTPCTRARCAR